MKLNNWWPKFQKFFFYSGTDLQYLENEKDGDYEIGAKIEGVQLNPLNYAPIRQENIKDALIPIHQVEGIIDECVNDIDDDGEITFY